MSAVPDSPRQAGSCRHRPINNGISRHGDVVFSWCGYCKAYILLDEEWIAKFKASTYKAWVAEASGL